MEYKEIKNEGLKREFELLVKAKDLEKRVEEELNSIAATIKVPGFRPGKVPFSLVKQRHSEKVFFNITEKLLDECGKKALEENNIRPAMQPNVELINKAEEGKDILAKMFLEVLPDITLVDFSNKPFDKYISEVSSEDVDVVLERLAKSQKDFVSIKNDRVSKKGDGLVINYIGTIDGKVFEGSEGKDFKVELGAQNSLPGFEEKLTGVKKGEKVLVNTFFPKDYFKENLREKAVAFNIEVRDILESKDFKVDDNLAKKNGMQDLSILKENVKKQLTKNSSDMSFSIIKRDMLDFLEEKHDFILPDSMVKFELESIFEQTKNDDVNKKIEGKDKKEDIDKAKNKEYKELAERRVKLGLIISEIGMKNQIRVEQKEIENAIMLHTQQYPGKEKEIMDYYKNNPQAVSAIRGPIFEDKVINFILSKCKINKNNIDQKQLSEKLADSQSIENKKDGKKNPSSKVLKKDTVKKSKK